VPFDRGVETNLPLYDGIDLRAPWLARGGSSSQMKIDTDSERFPMSSSVVIDFRT